MPRAFPRIQFLEDRSTPAAVGQLDLTFGNIGAVTPNVILNLPDTTVPTVIGRQSDGKLIVGSTAFLTAGDTDFAIFRLNTDGSIDTTFGTGGLTTVAFDRGGTNADRLNAIKVLSNDSIVAVGYAEGASGDRDFALAKLTAAGNLDKTFNTTGTKTISFNLLATGDDEATAVAVYNDGRIVVGGSVKFNSGTDYDFGLVRLSATGQLDTTFNTTGSKVIGIDIASSNLDDRLTGLAVGSNNTLVGVGTVNKTGSNTDAAVFRLLENGNFDSTFNTTGKRTYAIDNAGTTGENTVNGVVVLSNDEIVIAGTVAATGVAGNTDFYAGRLKSDGTPDNTFGTNGFVAAGFNLGGSKIDRASTLAVDPLGRVVIGGTVQINATDFDFGVSRFTSSGALDTSFDGDGGQQVPIDQGGSNVDTGYGLLVQPDGRIVIAGTATTASGAKVAVARLQGSLGIASALAAGGPADGSASTFIVDTSNKYVAGPEATIFANFAGPVRTAVADFNGDGVLDSAYGTGPGGGSLVRVIDGATGNDLIIISSAFEQSFTGGIFLAAGDIDGDGKAELAVSPDQGGGGRVEIFTVSNNALVQKDNFFGIDDANFRGGARVAIGDVDGDSRQDLIVGAGFGGGPRVAIFDGLSLLQLSANPTRIVGDFFAFPGPDASSLRNGVFVSAGDIDGDGFAELVFGGGPGGGPRVFGLSGALISAGNVTQAQAAPVVNFFAANDLNSRGGIRVTLKDLDDDQHADLVLGSGEGQSAEVRVYLGSSATSLVNSESAGALWQNFDPFGFAPAAGVYVG